MPGPQPGEPFESEPRLRGGGRLIRAMSGEGPSATGSSSKASAELTSGTKAWDESSIRRSSAGGSGAVGSRARSRSMVDGPARVSESGWFGNGRRGNRRRGPCGSRGLRGQLTRAGPRPALLLGARLRLRGRILSLQDARPVELDVGVVLFDQADRIFVERGPSDAHTGRRPEPVKDSGAGLPAAAAGVDDERVLVTTLVAAEPEVRQAYFLFCARATALRAGGLLLVERAAALRAAGFARLGRPTAARRPWSRQPWGRRIAARRPWGRRTAAS